MTLSRHFFLSFIASARFSGLHPVSSHSCCMYVRAGRPAFARPYVGVHRSTSLMSAFLLLQQCPACLVRLTWIVFVMGGRWTQECCERAILNKIIPTCGLSHLSFKPDSKKTYKTQMKEMHESKISKADITELACSA